MKFTLSYEGALTTGKSGASDKKHIIRQHFNGQLKRLWENNGFLKQWTKVVDRIHDTELMRDWIGRQMPILGEYRFVPLVTRDLSTECAIEVRLLRPTDKIYNIPDIDNQMKVLLDALKMPRDMQDLGGRTKPEADEQPFFILLQDDSLVSRLVSVQDELLASINGNSCIKNTDVRAFIDVYIRPIVPTADNAIFFDDSRQPWAHDIEGDGFKNYEAMRSSELRAEAAQCVFRIDALSQHYESNVYRMAAQVHVGIYTDPIDHVAQMNAIWSNLQPRAFAICLAMRRRIYGAPPYQTDHRLLAIDCGSLAGPSPLRDAASGMTSLIRQLHT